MVNGQSWAHLVRVRPLIKLPYEQLPLSAQTTSIPQRISSARERDAGERVRNRNVNRGRRTGMIDHSVDKHGQVKLVRRQTSVASSWKKGRNEQTNWNTHTEKVPKDAIGRQTDQRRERERGLEKLSVESYDATPDERLLSRCLGPWSSLDPPGAFSAATVLLIAL